MENKKLLQSKTIKFNIGIAFGLLALLEGTGIDPKIVAELAVVMIPVVNILLRLVTRVPVQLYVEREED